MKLDDIKAEMEKSFKTKARQRDKYLEGWDTATQHWLNRLNEEAPLELPDPAASLRRVREKFLNDPSKMFHYLHIIKIIDAELKEQKNVKQKTQTVEITIPDGYEFQEFRQDDFTDSCVHGPHCEAAIIFKPKIDHELEEVRKRFPVGSRFKVIWGSQKGQVKKVIEVSREVDRGRIIVNGWTLNEIEPLPLEPVWPDTIQDGWWIFSNNGTWYLVGDKPEFISKDVGFRLKNYNVLNLSDFLAPLGLTIDDLKIPDVPPEKRCWVKQSNKQ